MRLTLPLLLGLAVASAAAAHVMPAFDAASVTVVPLGAPVPIDLRFQAGSFKATNATLAQLIEQAYAIEARELVGGPDWVRVDRFNVTATTGQLVERERARLMLQALLADRFKLQLARETTTGTTFTLLAAKVHDLTPPVAPDARPRIAIARVDGNGYLSYRFEGRNATMSLLAQTLSAHLSAPVADETKIDGSHDFNISFAYDAPFGGLEPDPNLPTIFTALTVQLGLRLVAGKGSIPVYAIQQAAKPTAN
jgi:uncharacterized protein (TIGR03435 family)